MKPAVIEARLTRQTTGHISHDSFTTHLLERGQPIRTILELLGHREVGSTLVTTHRLKCLNRDVGSADLL